MGAGHGHVLYVHEHTAVHGLAPQVKILAALGMVVAIAVTPRRAVWAFALYAFLILVLMGLSRIPPGFVATRLGAVAPFVLFALVVPFVATGQTTSIGGVSMSIDGLWAMWNILAKAVLGASVTIILTATTEVSEIIRGLGTLRVPALFTAIAMFMIRYLELVAEELARVRVAMTARGYDPRWLSQARPIASAAGALFVRSYERGERIHAAMLSRGFTGTIPDLETSRTTAGEWAISMAWAALFGLVAVIAGVST